MPSIVLQDAPAVLGDPGSQGQQQCVDSLRLLLDELMQAGLIEQTSSPALARLINGSLINAALWIAQDDQSGKRLDDALQGLDFLLRGLKPQA